LDEDLKADNEDLAEHEQPQAQLNTTILVEVFLKDLRKQSCKAEPEKEAAY
jgi:hypothetical protein